ncbi:MAG: peptidylprolyl isomerase, partial [Candidatus Zixiibacteriota bacterium]
MVDKKILGCFFLTILLLSFYSGCGKSENRTIAKIDNYDLTSDEFNDYFSRIRLTYPTAQDEYNKKREVLDSIIVTRLFIQSAYEMNIDKLDEISRVILANKDKFLLDALYQSHIVSKAEPSDVELKDFYNRLEYKIRASHILVENLDTAQMLFERIKNGDNFEKLAFDYSIDPQVKQNNGDLGYFVWGAMVDSFQQAAFKMEPGEISPPVKSRHGYHIIKLVDKLLNEKRTNFASMKESIKAQLRNRKIVALTEEFLEAMKIRYPVTIETSTCEYLMHKREDMYPQQLLATLPKNDFDLEQLDRDEKELILASWDGGQLSLNEYLTQVKNVPPKLRPDFDDYNSLSEIVFELKKYDILVLEALRKGIDNDKEYLKKLRMFKELTMADIMKNDSIVLPPAPDEETLRQYYEDNAEEFTVPAKVHVYEILLSDELKARKLANEIKSLQEFKEKAMDLTERPGKRSKNGDLDY